jgi:predicted small metal-binding protein
MKQMKCTDMGGSCDFKITGNTPDEMMENGRKHLLGTHPEMMEQMKKSTPEDGKKWMESFMKKWNATPDMK